MSFVISSITPADREDHRLDAFDAQQPVTDHHPDWAIDREQQVFVRILRSDAGKSKRGDPDAAREVDFHLRWKHCDFIISTRRASLEALGSLPGEARGLSAVGERRVDGYYVWYVHRELCVSGESPSLDAVLDTFADALHASCGTAFSQATPAQLAEPRCVVLKLSPQLRARH